MPRAGARVQVRQGHTVLYDQNSAEAIRFIHVAGVLTFATDRDTRLDVGLLKIEQGEESGEDGFECTAHTTPIARGGAGPALLIGTPERPVQAGATAKIRLVRIDGQDPQNCPAIVSCAGRMEIHGAPMTRTWLKLGQTVKKGADTVRLAEDVDGWRVGDHVIVTATETFKNGRDQRTLRPGADGRQAFTEERTIAAIDGRALTLDRALAHDHLVRGNLGGEVANLSRNVVIESAEPTGVRGHTMYRRDSAGSISYAEFRHLGKEGLLGKYSLHFHMVGATMRGSSVVGASIWDSGNRFITLHATSFLVVRDCVGYGSVGHGFYLEDGSESFNVLDRNLAVHAYAGKPLPDQFLPFDRNDGAGFWWANSLNSFTRNVAVECDRYGFRFEATPDGSGRLARPVALPDGTIEPRDIRTLPFVRFDGNEAHSLFYGVNHGEGVDGVGPDASHPFVFQNMKIWDSLWCFRPGAPSIVIDNLEIAHAKYGIYLPQPDPRIQPHGRMTARRVNVPGYLPTSPTASPGTDVPVPVGKDDRPPFSIITRVARAADDLVIVRGTTADNGQVASVVVNGAQARAVSANFLEWEARVDPRSAPALTAIAADRAGNTERNPHVVPYP